MSSPSNRVAFGSWPSPLRSDRVSTGALRLSQPQLDGGSVYWLEGRPQEGGRQVLLRRQASADAQELSPEGENVRNCVHEYGGGDYLVRSGRLFSVRFPGSEIHELDVSGPVPGGEQLRFRSEQGARYADFDLSPDGRWLVAVEECPREGQEVSNQLVAFDVSKPGVCEPRKLVPGHDFVSFPRFSPDGKTLVFTSWEHPNMPWDGTHLFSMPWGPEGATAAPQFVAGGSEESIYQPRFSPDGLLTFVSDRSGWWNLDQQIDGELRALHPMAAEFGRPQWGLGMSSYAFIDERHLLCAVSGDRRDRLMLLDLERGEIEAVDSDFASIWGVQVEGQQACFVAASSVRAMGVFRFDLETRELAEIHSSAAAQSASYSFPSERVARPEPIEFPSADGRSAFAFYYPPTGFVSEAEDAPRLEGLPGEKPPLLVKSHGGPTAATSAALSLGIQYWTSRGIAVVDVDYGGSTGYGRAYRARLDGQWGVVDVEDCVAAAQFLARVGRVDPERMAISGGSAGGYTTLCALTYHDVFRAGASHYGICDLEALVRDTHKFESRYMDRLVGPYPAARARYLARSPIHSADRLSCPVIFFQGLEDKIVLPNQAEAMAAALAARGIPHAYVPFPGEQHGFRRAENICTALDGELWFYSQVFGFHVGEAPPGVEIVR